MTSEEGTRRTVPTDRLAAEVFDGEAVILDLQDGSYYSLIGAAADVWMLAGAAHTIEEIETRLVDRYGQDASRDVQPFVADLERAGLLIVDPEADAAREVA